MVAFPGETAQVPQVMHLVHPGVAGDLEIPPN